MRGDDGGDGDGDGDGDHEPPGVALLGEAELSLAIMEAVWAEGKQRSQVDQADAAADSQFPLLLSSLTPGAERRSVGEAF